MRVLREDGSGYELDDDEIVFFTTHNNVISVHTRTERYIVPTTLDQLSKAYQDLSFDKVDRSYSVKMDRIAGYHAVRKAVYFEEETTDNTKYAPVSEPNMKKVLKHLEKKKDQP
ncbi:LytTR family transcriptional regulator DNA-binding domain-containing protein [Paenibacillus tyrfis]|uniref:HTH LytTR-type domain-containing protein n=1 Tax=Paenibacillus tyrfis TaxID=1501230 RepID=A0A081P7A7_9BACL|nr:LytTR family transcriptional regulator DNA-binding domain-containing protein [Paenibacillus tyrfis]KEQ26580.1 hypothetical protein ET33_32570 [Paenibacillus tyrfis]